jgi:hypothetical protein
MNPIDSSTITYDPQLRNTNGGADLGQLVIGAGPTLPGGDVYYVGGTIVGDQWPTAGPHFGTIIVTLDP